MQVGQGGADLPPGPVQSGADRAERDLEDHGDGPALTGLGDRLGAAGDLEDVEATGTQDAGEAFPCLDVRVSDEHRVDDLIPPP